MMLETHSSSNVSLTGGILDLFDLPIEPMVVVVIYQHTPGRKNVLSFNVTVTLTFDLENPNSIGVIY